MTDKKILDNIKKLREITGVGFSDCKIAITAVSYTHLTLPTKA